MSAGAGGGAATRSGVFAKGAFVVSQKPSALTDLRLVATPGAAGSTARSLAR